MKLDGNVCRVCLCSKGTVVLFDGFSDELFRYCTMLEAKADDGFPSKLCKVCTNHMRIAYDFRFQAIYAEQYFQKIINHALGSMENMEEHMQEIDQLMMQNSSLLITETANVQEENAAFLSVHRGQYTEQEGQLVQKGILAEPVTDSDGLSDHFENLFDCFDKTAKLCRRQVGCKIAEDAATIQLNSDTNVKKRKDEGDRKANESTMTVNDREQCNVTAKLKKGYQNEAIEKEKAHKVECNVCGTTFTHINSLKQHLLKHSGERPYRCDFCEKTFTRRTILNIHRRLHTGERPYGCDECVQTFVTKDAMNRHKEREHKEAVISPTTAHDEVTYTSAVCKKTRFNKQVLWTHMCSRQQQKHKKHNNTSNVRMKRQRVVEKPRHNLQLLDDQGRPLPTVKYCKTCQQGFASKWELVAHQEEHEGAQQFACTACECSFEKQYKLLRHLETHENAEARIRQCILPRGDGSGPDEEDTPLTVRIKDHYCRTKRNMSRELQTHCCEQCGATFRRQELLNMHRRRHAAQQQPHNCPHCGANGMSKEALKEHFVAAHAATVSATNGFDCDACNASFNAIGEYADHWTVEHATSLEFMCNICARKFNKKCKLLYHLEVHKLRRYACKKCGQILAGKEQLLCHIKNTHFDRRNHDYQCPECAAGLYDMRDLKLHLNDCHDARIGDLNACDLCSLPFGTVLEYYGHVYAQHDSISKTCDECGKYFESRKCFDKHVFGHYMSL